uniref:Glutathione synthetase n=1 Tax=Arion vulgaris TaxID=1028688 RepID=A0A0B6ZT03_9EUPU
MATSVKDVTIPDWRLQEILNVTNEWTLCNGVSIKSGTDGAESTKAVSAPYALFPSVVPVSLLHQAKSTMVEFNRLMHKVAMDHEFLEQSLKNVIEVDEFMGKLWKIYLEVRKSNVQQPVMLGLFRNDFMMNSLNTVAPGDIVSADTLELKQIEFNAIASSFGGLAQQMSSLHRLSLGLSGKSFTDKQLPENEPATGLASGMLKAWELYGNPRAIIVFLVSPQERNEMDQRWLEFKVYDKNPSVRILRKTFVDFDQTGFLDNENRLFIGKDEVAVIYLRDGYTAENYPSETEWNGRLKIELSKAIKCPSIQYQLVGAKKIQQELARTSALEKFIPDPKIAKSVRDTFAGQYSLDLGPEGDNAVELALAAPDKFVLKPQREGGGHNMYNAEISTFLTQHKHSKERNAYILMQRIFPWQQRNYLVKAGVPFVLSDVVSELGIYGVYIGSNDQEIENFECGHMMRTKISGTDEGGIVAGFAVLDTPFLI